MTSTPSHQSGVGSGLIGALPLATMATSGIFAASNSPNPPTESSFEFDWLPNSIMIVKLAKDGAEAIPFSFVRGVFGMVLTLLETVQVCEYLSCDMILTGCPQKAKENHDDLREVCAHALEIVQHVDKMIKLHGDAIAGTFKDLCTKFMRFVMSHWMVSVPQNFVQFPGETPAKCRAIEQTAIRNDRIFQESSESR
jgi:hypothetical protein